MATLMGSEDEIVIVEPITNWLVELLARLRQARRVEYSGLQPEWLRLDRVRQLADAHGHTMEVETWWEVPRSRLARRVRKSRRLSWPFFAAVRCVTIVTRPLRFGSVAAVRLRRPSDELHRAS